MKNFLVERPGSRVDTIKADTYIIEMGVLNFYDTKLSSPNASFPAGEWLSVKDVKEINIVG